jgi:hypothetical protein
VAHEADIKLRTVERWEKGKSAFESSIRRVAEVLGVPTFELYVPQFPPRDRLNENQMFWFKAALDYSLRGLPPIELDLEQQSDAVQPLGDRIPQQIPDMSRRRLLSGSLKAVFDNFGKSVLILVVGFVNPLQVVTTYAHVENMV